MVVAIAVEVLYARCVEAKLLKEINMTGPTLKVVSGQSELSTTEHSANDGLRHEIPDLRVGDVVRSKETYWLKTGQHLTGAIVSLEKVPKSQIQAVGCDCWAYLNSGEGPISLAALEKVPSQLESLNAALEKYQQEVEPEEFMNGSKK